MRHKLWFYVLILALAVVLSGLKGAVGAQGPTSPDTVGTLAALGTTFTYQGQLTQGGSPADGTYDFRFILYDAEFGGSQIGSTLNWENVALSDGRFTVQLDFGGNVFAGEARYLEVAVRPGDSGGSYTVLSPRQALTATPYALYAQSAPWSGLTGVPTGLDDGDDDTLYSAGEGLTLAGTEFNVSFAGSGTATTAARSDHNHDALYAPTDVVPSGAVMFFNLSACPSGWHELTDAQGRYLIGLPDGGTLGATVGTALSDSENRAVGRHSHGYSDPGHSHSISDPGHFHYTSSVLRRGGTWGDQNGGPYYVSSSTGAYTDRRGTGISVNARTTQISINPTGSTGGTNAPYVQLLVCERD